uniref:polyprenyl synthetase family protein n=1 Tax=Ningiella ruwaisensis TaxID=2364274 RepID=UPI00144772FE|nr:polyprenyl synthetase family protein [Ningiella ruwaisensis]
MTSKEAISQFTSIVAPISYKGTLNEQISFETYEQATKRASWYFTELCTFVDDPATLESLGSKFKNWEQSRRTDSHFIYQSSAFDANTLNSWSLIDKLRAEKQLDAYLNKTISYLFMRDLGRDLNDPQTKNQIDKVVKKLGKSLKKQSVKSKQTQAQDVFEQQFKQIAQDKQIESSYQWLMLKVASLQTLFDSKHHESEGLRKLVKVVAGVLMHQLIENPDASSEDLDKSIKLGYCYGLTYPFVDDLLDSNHLLANDADKALFTQALRRTLQNGEVAPMPAFSDNVERLQQIYEELKWAFEYIQHHLPVAQGRRFFNQAYVFFEAQAQDRALTFSKATQLSLESLFVPVMLKSAGSRLIVRDLVTHAFDAEYDYRSFCFGIYNQFNDDIKDVFDDMKEGNVTPYTRFLHLKTSTTENTTCLKTNDQKTNDQKTKTPEKSPYEYYWAVVYYLISVVYKDNKQCRSLLLERSINAHKSLLQKVGKEKYAFLRQNLLFTSSPAFDAIIDRLVSAPTACAWFDKLISQEISLYFKAENEKKKKFKDLYQTHLDFVNANLKVSSLPRYGHGRLAKIVDDAITAGGKRLRPVIASFMSQSVYQFTHQQCVETIKMLEYMHTASLILDDLPTQDNASQRRGQPTIHVKYQSQATAELSAVYLMMRAVEVQSSIKSHPPCAVLSSLAYAANTTQLVCEGQLQDLKKDHCLDSQSELENLYWLKTGLALEAAFVIPAILAQQDEVHISMLKRIAKYLGIAFQIKDDLLDINASALVTGKSANKDSHSMVQMLGEQAAVNLMFTHQAKALSLIERHLPAAAQSFLKSLVDYIVYRSH